VLFFKQSIKFPRWFCLNQPSTFELSPQVGLRSQVPNEAKNEAKMRPENSFGNPSALAAVYHQPGGKSLADNLEAVWQQLSSSLHAAQ